MRIDSGTIGMDSARLYKSAMDYRASYDESAVSGQGSENALTAFNMSLKNSESPEGEEESSGLYGDTDTLKQSFELLGNRNLSALETDSRSIYAEFEELHQLMIKSIFELLFGGHFDDVVKNSDLGLSGLNDTGYLSNPDNLSYEIVTTNFTSSGYYSESESTKFQAVGTVQTADGRSIDVNLNVSMSRSFTSYFETQISTESLQLCDPLVINYNGNLAGLDSEMSFYFDLDMDGEEEKITRLTEGSGFLALDLNEDGVINDGSELFGTTSGDGFADLAAYDEDGDGWIDEDDSVFDKLKIWSKDSYGNDVLYTLKDLNVGAIYTGSAQTQFSLNAYDNSTLGLVRETGVFLYEDGSAGTVQHVDLVS